MTEPDLVGGVVAIDAPPSLAKGNAEQAAEADEVRRALATASQEKLAGMIHRRFSSMMSDQERARRFAEQARRSSRSVIAEAFYDLMTRDLRAQTPNIRAPVLVVRTTGNIPAEMLGAMERDYREQLAPIPRHELVIVPGAKHYLMFDAPDVFLAHQDRFLAATARNRTIGTVRTSPPTLPWAAAASSIRSLFGRR